MPVYVAEFILARKAVIFIEAENVDDAALLADKLSAIEVSKYVTAAGYIVDDWFVDENSVPREAHMRTERAAAPPEFDSHSEDEFNHDWRKKRDHLAELKADREEE